VICSFCQRKIPDGDVLCFTCYEDAMNPKKPCPICKSLTHMDLCEECGNKYPPITEENNCDYKWER
jgi:hypothetical protein